LEVPFAFVDLEMTGLDIARDRVLEICVDRVKNGRTEAFVHSLVNPGERLGGNAHIHGIDAADVARAPSFAEVAQAVSGVLDGAVLVAHAAIWDVRFLESEFRRAGRALDLEHFVDTLALARRAFAFHSNSLDALCRELGIERGRAHRADSDVRAMRTVFDRCVDVLKPVSARDLWEVRVGDRQARQAVVDACEAAALRGTPMVVTYRPAGRPAESMEMVILEVRSHLDPPRIVGYQQPGRGRRELRADRILRVEPQLAHAPS
jgi:DNA polymerase-3 subunit epsilon